MYSIVWNSLFYAWIASEILIAAATRTRQSTGNVRDRGSQVLLWIVFSVSITGCEWIRHIVKPNLFDGGDHLIAFSIFVLAAALALRWAAVINLGKSFSANVAIHQSQTVYRTGLYAFVRHPSYSGLVLIFLAIGLHSRNWLSLTIALVPTTAALLYRIQIEEAALLSAFGDEYASYARKTKRLFPGIY